MFLLSLSVSSKIDCTSDIISFLLHWQQQQKQKEQERKEEEEEEYIIAGAD